MDEDRPVCNVEDATEEDRWETKAGRQARKRMRETAAMERRVGMGIRESCAAGLTWLGS